MKKHFKMIIPTDHPLTLEVIEIIRLYILTSVELHNFKNSSKSDFYQHDDRVRYFNEIYSESIKQMQLIELDAIKFIEQNIEPYLVVFDLIRNNILLEETVVKETYTILEFSIW